MTKIIPVGTMVTSDEPAHALYGRVGEVTGHYREADGSHTHFVTDNHGELLQYNPIHLVRVPKMNESRNSIAHNAVNKYVTKSNLSEEQILFKKCENRITESQFNVLYSLFENLDDRNRLIMLETVETKDGINRLLNFAITKNIR